MRVLVVTNMWPSPERPALGSFVRDQVLALRRLDGLDVDLFSFPPGGYARAALDLRRRHGHARYDVVHAHFGLSAYPALVVRGAPHGVTLHGTDVRHPRSGRLTRAVLRAMDLVAAVSEPLAAEVRASTGGREVAVLPCGVALDRFVPLDRAECRAQLGLDRRGRYLLLPADPARPGKRADRARALATATGAQLLTAGDVLPEEMPTWVNAANAVVVPSDAEGFGLAVLEALACDVPVLATPTGIHAEALAGIGGTACAPWELSTWEAAVAEALDAEDPRVSGRERAARWSADAMARGVAEAWSALSGTPLYSAPEAPANGASSV